MQQFFLKVGILALLVVLTGCSSRSSTDPSAYAEGAQATDYGEGSPLTPSNGLSSIGGVVNHKCLNKTKPLTNAAFITAIQEQESSTNALAVGYDLRNKRANLKSIYCISVGSGQICEWSPNHRITNDKNFQKLANSAVVVCDRCTLFHGSGVILTNSVQKDAKGNSIYVDTSRGLGTRIPRSLLSFQRGATLTQNSALAFNILDYGQQTLAILGILDLEFNLSRGNAYWSLKSYNGSEAYANKVLNRAGRTTQEIQCLRTHRYR